MTSNVRRALAPAALAVFAVAVGAAPTFAGSVKVGAVKGATYTGVFHGETLTVKVAKNGKTATASLPDDGQRAQAAGDGRDQRDVLEVRRGQAGLPGLGEDDACGQRKELQRPGKLPTHCGRLATRRRASVRSGRRALRP
jgi:hypothetical protein